MTPGGHVTDLMHRAPSRAGIGLRLPHLAEVVATRPSVGWFEVHPENFLANPHAAELLVEVARQYPVSVHTVGVSVGSATGIDRRHLQRVGRLIETIDPILVSGHLAWSTHAGQYLNDLLPLPYTRETLAIVAAQVAEVQDALGRRYLVENPSSYVGFAGSTMDEVTFLSELVRMTGCGLLCDVSNVHLSAHNLTFDRLEYIDRLPADAVEELHLGGFTVEQDPASPDAELYVDTHGSVVDEGAWELYRHTVARFGARPTLVEWDNDLPSLGRLTAEADRADAVSSAALENRHVAAG